MPKTRKTRARKPAGRPRHYDDQHLMDAWLFVEALRARTGLPARQVCLKYALHWVQAGVLLDPPGKRKTGRLLVKQSASKETLRRRYQEAVRFLKSEAELHKRIRPGTNVISPTEERWRCELKMRLAYFGEPKKNG